MAIPDGYVALDFVGFTDQGTYDSTATYMINDLVHDTYNNIWKCLQDNTSNVAPAAGAYWSLFMGASDSLTAMTATDTSGVLGSAGQIVVAQALVDAIANRVMNDLILKSKITTSLAVTETGFVPDATLVTQLNSDLATKAYMAYPVASTIAASSAGNICGWLTLPSGVYMLFGLAYPQSGVSYVLKSGAGDEYAISPNNGSVFTCVSITDTTSFVFEARTGSASYNISADGRYYRLIALRISQWG